MNMYWGITYKYILTKTSCSLTYIYIRISFKIGGSWQSGLSLMSHWSHHLIDVTSKLSWTNSLTITNKFDVNISFLVILFFRVNILLFLGDLLASFQNCLDNNWGQLETKWTTLKQHLEHRGNWDTTLGQLWNNWQWDKFETTLTQLWHNFKTTLTQIWDNFGTTLRNFGITLGPHSDYLVTIDGVYLCLVGSIGHFSAHQSPTSKSALFLSSSRPLLSSYSHKSAGDSLSKFL